MNTRLLTLLCAAAPALGALADVPEPDCVLYGLITLGSAPVAASDTSIVVEARKTAAGPVIATYQMGSRSDFGNYYSLRVALEAFLPAAQTNAARAGSLLFLTVRQAGLSRLEKTTSIASRGSIIRLDFAEPDADADGLPDSWEQRYFGSPTGADPNADPDRDGRSNRAEFRDGTLPLLPDGRHPADIAPADNSISIAESESYAQAWLAGQSWSGEPTNISLSYVARAAMLAASGGPYLFTNAPATNAPLWWVAAPPAPPLPTGTNHTVSDLPSSLPSPEPFRVTLAVTPAPGALAYALEDQPPTNWLVSDITHGGAFDPVRLAVKWGPFYDDGPRDLAYTALPDPSASGTFAFSGAASFDGADQPIAGVRSITIIGSGASNPPLRFLSCQRLPGGLALAFEGRPSRPYAVETSTNLSAWAPLQTNTTDSLGRCQFLLPDPARDPCRFYRLHAP